MVLCQTLFTPFSSHSLFNLNVLWLYFKITQYYIQRKEGIVKMVQIFFGKLRNFLFSLFTFNIIEIRIRVLKCHNYMRGAKRCSWNRLGALCAVSLG